MDAQPDPAIEATYNEYIGEANRLRKNNLRAFSLYRLSMLFGLIPMVMALLNRRYMGYFWGGVILAAILYVAAVIAAYLQEKNSLAKAALSRPGFAEFYKLCGFSKVYMARTRENYWPTVLPPGEKTDKFLSIIGRKTAP